MVRYTYRKLFRPVGASFCLCPRLLSPVFVPDLVSFSAPAPAPAVVAVSVSLSSLSRLLSLSLPPPRPFLFLTILSHSGLIGLVGFSEDSSFRICLSWAAPGTAPVILARSEPSFRWVAMSFKSFAWEKQLGVGWGERYT